MRINDVAFPTPRKPVPPIIFVGRPVPILPVVGGFVAVGLTATAILDYLTYLSLYRRVEVIHRHDNI